MIMSQAINCRAKHNPLYFAPTAALAQLVEQFIRNEKVASSIPASGTTDHQLSLISFSYPSIPVSKA